MKVGLIIGEDGHSWIMLRPNANDVDELQQDSDVLEQKARAIALLDFTGCKDRHRGDVGTALDALDAILAINHFHEDSLGLAAEHLLTEVFDAGRRYEKEIRSKEVLSNSK